MLPEYRRRLEAMYGARLERLVLFGSQARGEARPDSDIDVLIVLSGPLDDWAETERTSAATSEVSMEFETDISRLFATPEDYAANASLFFDTVRREGVVI